MAQPTVIILNYFIIRAFPAIATALLSLFLFFFFFLLFITFQVMEIQNQSQDSKMGPHQGLTGVFGSLCIHYPSADWGKLYTLKFDIFMDFISASLKQDTCLSCSYASGHMFAFFQTAERKEEALIHSKTQCTLGGGLYLQHR